MAFTPYPHQVTAIKWMVNKRRGLVVVPPGRGKTAMALGTAKVLFRANKIERGVVLVHKRGVVAYKKLDAGIPVTTASTVAELRKLPVAFERDPNQLFVIGTNLFLQWEREFDELPDEEAPVDDLGAGIVDYDPLTGELLGDPPPKKGRKGKAPRKVSLDQIAAEQGSEDLEEGGSDPDSSTLASRTPRQTHSADTEPLSESVYNLSIIARITRSSPLVVVDEIHNYRNKDSKTAQVLDRLLLDHPGRVLAMTATPVYKHVENLFPLFSYLDPLILGSWAQFADSYLIQKERETQVYRWTITPQGRRRVIQPMRFKEVIGYKNLDQLRAALDPFLYEDLNTDFKINFALDVYHLSESEEATYVSAIRGENLAACTKVRVAGPRSTFTLVFRDGETVKLVTGEDADPKDLVPGQEFHHVSSAGEPVVVSVRKTGEGLTEADVISRLQKMVVVISETETKKASLLKILSSVQPDRGALVFCKYLDTVDTLEGYLSQHLSGRVVHTLVGGEDDMDERMASFGPTDIVIISQVALQSVDFYYDTLVVYEPITNPGGFEQLVGRITRTNSLFREVNVHFLVGNKTIDMYFYEKLRLLVKTNFFATIDVKDLPSIYPEEVSVDLRFLKDMLLWRRSYDGKDGSSSKPRELKRW